MVSREEIHELVGLFYRSSYKTFYVNSSNGKDLLSKPRGVFVSLGMTTSRRVLENIRDFLGGSKKYVSRIAEISSVKVGEQYLNTLSENNSDPQQYRLTVYPEGVMGKDAAMEELEMLRSKMNPAASLETLTEYSHKLNKLRYLVDRLDESHGWDSHLIQKVDDSDYCMFHCNVNYERRDGVEYRLGILVQENNDRGENVEINDGSTN